MTVICDIDGVVYRGDQLIPGSDRALQRLVTAGVDLYFATNNSTKTPANVAERISTMTGVDIRCRLNCHLLRGSGGDARGRRASGDGPGLGWDHDGTGRGGDRGDRRSHGSESAPGRARLGLELRTTDQSGGRSSSRGAVHRHQHRPDISGSRWPAPRWGSDGCCGASDHRSHPRGRRQATPTDEGVAPGSRDRSGMDHRRSG